jgi:hypothetical protein
MTTPAAAIKTGIHQLIDLQILIFGQATPLTSSELEDCRRRAERIKLLGQQLDQFGVAAIINQRFGKAS